MKIHENFKKIRQEKGFTQEQFADVLHVDGSAISKIESGERKIAVDELIALASLIEEELIKERPKTAALPIVFQQVASGFQPFTLTDCLPILALYV